MSEQDFDLELFLNTNKKRISSQNAKTIFRNVIDRTEQLDRKIFYDFLGEVLMEKPNLLKGKHYLKLLKSYDSAIGYLVEKIDAQQLTPFDGIEMERYFLEKYCLFESEEILLSFSGTLTHDKYMIGRVFITNYRIIVFGSMPLEGKSTVMPWAGIIVHIGAAIGKQISKDILSSTLRKTVDTSESKDKVYFGFQYPISHPTAITLKKRKRGKFKGSLLSVKFNSKTKTRSFNLKICVLEQNSEEKYHKIVEILQNLQDQQF